MKLKKIFCPKCSEHIFSVAALAKEPIDLICYLCHQPFIFSFDQAVVDDKATDDQTTD